MVVLNFVWRLLLVRLSDSCGEFHKPALCAVIKRMKADCKHLVKNIHPCTFLTASFLQSKHFVSVWNHRHPWVFLQYFFPCGIFKMISWKNDSQFTLWIEVLLLYELNIYDAKRREIKFLVRIGLLFLDILLDLLLNTFFADI